MSHHPKVLAITKRTAELCGTQSLLYRAGLDLVAATSLGVARVVINSIPVRGVILCLDSWTVEERKAILTELATNHPDIEVIVRCLGCTGCDAEFEITKRMNSAAGFEALFSKVPIAEA